MLFPNVLCLCLFSLPISPPVIGLQALRLSKSSSGWRTTTTGRPRCTGITRILQMSSEDIATNPLPAQPVPKTDLNVARSSSKKGKSWLKCRPIGIGGSAGQSSLNNQVFETLVDTNDAWISKRTGIRNRHVIETGSSLRDLAASSARIALAQSGVDAADIDLVIVATSSPDDLFGDAATVASLIGAHKAAAFDLTAACSGFLYATVTAAQFLHSGAYKKVLVIGADALSRFLDWGDRSTCILFGDGSGAMVLESTEEEADSGLLGFSLHSDGVRGCNLELKWNANFKELNNELKTVVDQGQFGKMKMNGPEVYKFAVNEVSYSSDLVPTFSCFEVLGI